MTIALFSFGWDQVRNSGWPEAKIVPLSRFFPFPQNVINSNEVAGMEFHISRIFLHTKKK
jgi:hypothetical protein